MADRCNHFSFTDDGDSFESWQGLRGPYYIPHLSADGVLSWTNTGNLPNPAPVDISGPPGVSVELRGPVASVQDLPATAPSSELWLVGTASPYDGWFYNGASWENAGQIAVGPAGPAGEDGVSPEISVTDITGGHRVTIIDAGGTETFDVMDGTDGAPGSPGAPGADGISPEISVTDITGGHRITITDATGTETFDVMDGTDGQPGQPGTPGAPGADGVSPEVTIAQISGGHSVTITDADHPQGQQFDVLDGTDGQTGPAGPGVPTGGTAGQVLTKTGAADYATGWQDPSGGDVTADMLGIVINGNSTPVGAAAGQYVIVKNSTISGITDGLYKAAQAIPANTTIDATYLTAVSNGGLNEIASTTPITTFFDDGHITMTYFTYPSLKIAFVYCSSDGNMITDRDHMDYNGTLPASIVPVYGASSVTRKLGFITVGINRNVLFRLMKNQIWDDGFVVVPYL